MRSARRRMQEIERLTPKERHEQQVPKYRQLIRTTEQVVQNARAVLQQTQGAQTSSSSSARRSLTTASWASA